MAPRTTPPDRIKELLRAATRVFIDQGYRRAQMADVARELGVAKGTLYLYVESKEALFDYVLRHAAGELSDPDALALPLAAREPGAVREDLRRRLAQAVLPLPLLHPFTTVPTMAEARESLEAVLRDLFDFFSANRTAIKLIDRCSAEHPELGDLFYREGRYAQVDHLAAYLERGMQVGCFRRFESPVVAARYVHEALVTWAVHIHWDPSPQQIDPRLAEATVMQMLQGALLLPETAA